jgi:hypothetical protein
VWAVLAGRKTNCADASQVRGTEGEGRALIPRRIQSGHCCNDTGPRSPVSFTVGTRRDTVEKVDIHLDVLGTNQGRSRRCAGVFTTILAPESACSGIFRLTKISISLIVSADKCRSESGGHMRRSNQMVIRLPTTSEYVGANINGAESPKPLTRSVEATASMAIRYKKRSPTRCVCSNHQVK